MPNQAPNPDPSGHKPRRKYISQSDIPAVSLNEAMRVPRAIIENYGGDPTRPIDIATALDMTPSSGTFRTICGASLGYGMTEGGPNASEITLTGLGRRIFAPLHEGEDLQGLKEAALSPSIAKRFYEKYDGSQLPPTNIANNVLASLGVPANKTRSVHSLLLENAERVGITKKIKDKTYIDINSKPTNGSYVNTQDDSAEWEMEAENTEEETDSDVISGNPIQNLMARTPVESKPKNAIFLGHGSNRRPLEQLIRILDEYGIPHKEAVDEANRARPIPTKVAEVMNECGAAVLVFTGDKEYFDKDGTPVWKPSENVSHELGAASVLYGDRIVIFKEKGIDLPSNFSSLGYIEFEKDRLSEKGIELFRELVSMKILNISVGAP